MRRLWLPILLLVGCTGDLDPPYRLERVRVLAVQTTVEGTDLRATPMPGESATVRWLVADPSGTETPLTWRMRVCVEQGCATGSIVEEEGAGVPTLTFVVPAGVEGSLHVEGIGCTEGALPASPFERCVGATVLPEVVEASIPIAQSPDEWNDNPDATGFDVTIDGALWPEGDPDCALADAQPMVVADEEPIAVAFAVDDSEREAEVPFLLSHVVTEGELDAHFAVLDAGEPNAPLALPWTPSVDTEGSRSATHLFVARDGRGGVAWTRRVVCVRENPS